MSMAFDVKHSLAPGMYDARGGSKVKPAHPLDEPNLFGDLLPAPAQGSVLADNWDYPPFSVLNAREGWWQDRKRAWLALGIESELGRGGELIPNGGGQHSRDRYNAAGGG